MHDPDPANVFVDDKWLAARYGRHRSALWRWAKSGEFPKPFQITKGCVRWRLSEVLDHEARASRVGGV